MKRFLFISLIIGSLGFYISCTEPFPELPPETQTGEKTFGCLVNGELVIASWHYEWGLFGKYSVTEAHATYNREDDQLIINAKCQFDSEFILSINHPYQRADLYIDKIRYQPPKSNEWMEAIHTGYLYITRLDNIVSGVFSFNLEAEGKKTVSVTQGRFDLNLDRIYYY
ncbi:hypothetical protein FACS189413_08680 [Bacteroidia bacterium]|nr:hypothetical protein FACS189463_3300 [Bacteroidia bacterium]GHU69561.1 hypothetical protein FACS189413_08680 [Bacteroidia bacterium]